MRSIIILVIWCYGYSKKHFILFNDSLSNNNNMLGGFKNKSIYDDFIVNNRKCVTIVEETEADMIKAERKIRPRSAPAKRSRPLSGCKDKRPNKIDKEKDELISSFNRSLRLLGLQINNTHNNESKQFTFKPPKVEKPSFSTRLSERCVSLDNLENLRDRAILSSAIYQEWYFTKLEQEKRKRLEDSTIRVLQQQQAEQRKLELKEKAEENYKRWLQRKAIEKAEKEAKEKLEKEKEEEKAKEEKEKIERALLEYKLNLEKRLKNELRKKKEKEISQAEKKLKDDEEKREHAKAAYAAWHKKAKELKIERIKKELKIKEKEEKQKFERKMRQKEAEKSFEIWRKNKESYLKKQIQNLKVKETRTNEERKQKIAERMYEADLAYSNWLDTVSERNCQVIRKYPTLR